MSASKHIFRLSLILSTLTLLAGCIKNNLPYPRLQVNFTSIHTAGQLQAPTIDSIGRTVTLYLSEEVDITSVRIDAFSISPAGSEWPDSAAFMEGTDMTRPITTTLRLYQDYDWTITAVQDIERYFTVEQQVGASTIDVPGRRVIAYVPEKAPLKALTVTSIKLAGSTSVISPDIDGQKVDFSAPVEVDVTEFGRTSTWTLYVIPTESTVTTERVDPWSCVAWLYGTAESGKDNGFEYRRADSQAWIRLTPAQITADGGSFTGRLTGLTPEMAYVARAYSGDEYGAEVEFTTQPTAQMPDSDFSQWWLDGKVWCPWPEGGESYWDTGNKGATTLGASNTYPVEDSPAGNGSISACLETKFVGIGIIGKLAAGNIFAGRYVKTDGTNGILSFGRPFTLRPTRLTGWMKYHSAPISSVTSGFEDLKGQPDHGIVWVALIDSPEPFEIRTNPSNRQLFNPDAPDVIAYGKMEWDTDVAGWTDFEVVLNYKSTSRTPRYILCTASASYLGDYFTGGNGSMLHLSGLRLEFDY